MASSFGHMTVKVAGKARCLQDPSVYDFSNFLSLFLLARQVDNS